jgi:hypothetical protein
VLDTLSGGFSSKMPLDLCNNYTLNDYTHFLTCTMLRQFTNMHLSSFLVVATVTFRVAQADFMVYTVPPIPTDSIPKFTDPAEVGFQTLYIISQPTKSAKASGWTLSVAVVANSAYNSFTKELGSTYHSSQSSAASEIKAFVQSARNYSIPADVTDLQATTTFFSKPDWYDALPTGARAFKELQVSDQFSIVRSIIDAGKTMASSTGAAVPTAQAFLDVKFGAMAAAAAAVFF